MTHPQVLSDDDLWSLWNAQGSDEMNKDEAIAFARQAISATLAALGGQEPIGYFRAMPFGWEDCAAGDEGAVALYTAPAPAVPSGWKLVPMEPPRHMMECAEALPAIDPNDLRLRRLGWTLGACQNRRRYLQMLNAAPNPDQKGSDA